MYKPQTRPLVSGLRCLFIPCSYFVLGPKSDLKSWKSIKINVARWYVLNGDFNHTIVYCNKPGLLPERNLVDFQPG